VRQWSPSYILSQLSRCQTLATMLKYEISEFRSMRHISWIMRSSGSEWLMIEFIVDGFPHAGIMTLSVNVVHRICSWRGGCAQTNSFYRRLFADCSCSFDWRIYATIICLIGYSVNLPCIPTESPSSHSPYAATPLNAQSCGLYLCSLSITYGTSTSSSVVSSQVISKMTLLWCAGIGFLLIVSTSSLSLEIVSNGPKCNIPEDNLLQWHAVLGL